MTTSPTIVGYTYRADNYHPACILHELEGDRDPYVSVEDRLDRLAHLRGIDRTDEYTFDSDDFPKVIHAYQVTDTQWCGAGCDEPLT